MLFAAGRRKLATLVGVSAAMVVLTACSNGGDETPAAEPTNEPTATPITADSFPPTPTPVIPHFVPGPTAVPTRSPAVEPYPTRTPTPVPPPPMEVVWLTEDDVPEPLSGTVYEDLLARLPDNSGTRSFTTLADQAGVMEFLGFEIPAPTESEEVVFDFLLDMIRTGEETGFASGIPVWPSGARDYISVYDRYENVGFEHWSVWQTANAGEPPNAYDFAFGDFDPQLTAEKLAGCDCDQPDIQLHSGVGYYTWGPEFIGDLRKRHDPPLYDHVGRGPRLLIRPGEGFYSISNQAMADFIDVAEGNISSLADNDEYVEAARALAGLGLMRDMTFIGSGLAANDAQDFTNNSQTLFQETIRTVELLKPFDLLTSGVGFDGEAAFTGLVIVNPDPSTAEFNAERLIDRIWNIPVTTQRSDTLADFLSRVEIGVEGNLTLTRLYFRDPAPYLFGFPLRHADMLILHDGPGTGEPASPTVSPATP